jgi:hypothetical protein
MDDPVMPSKGECSMEIDRDVKYAISGFAGESSTFERGV